MFGIKLKNLRTKSNLTQKQLAEKLKVAQSTIGMYESGKRMPDTDLLSEIANLFNVSIDFLVSRDDLNTSNITSVLSEKEKKDIAKDLENVKKELMESEELMFDGQPMSNECIESILSALEIGMEMVRKKNKAKYTPKKYRK